MLVGNTQAKQLTKKNSLEDDSNVLGLGSTVGRQKTAEMHAINRKTVYNVMENNWVAVINI